VRSADRRREAFLPTTSERPKYVVALVAHQLIEAVRIEADHHLFSDDQGRSGATVVGVDQLLYRLRVRGNIAIYELDTSRREVGLGCAARGSTGLGEQDDAFGHAA